MPSDYTPEEAEAILTRAAGRKSVDSISHRRLVEMAEELGISPEEVAAAAEEILREQEEKSLRRQFIAERRSSLWPHLIPYLCVNLGFVFINLMNYHGKFWAIGPILGWGIGLTIHLASILPTSGTEFEKEFAKWRKVQESKAQRKARRASKKAAASATPQTTGVALPLVHTVQVDQEQAQPLQQQSGR